MNPRGLLVVLGLVGSVLRLYKIGQQSLWIDEAEIYLRALRPTFIELIGKAPNFLMDPLHPVLLHFWLKIGTSDAHARILSAAFGIATIFLFYRLFSDIFNVRVGLICAGLLTINPFHVWYSQEARLYSVFLFLSALSTLLLWRASRRSDRRLWGAYGIVLALAGLTHQTAVFMGLAHILFVVYSQLQGRKVLKPFLITSIAVALALLPFFAFRLSRISPETTRQFDKPTGLPNLAYIFYSQIVGFSLGPSIYEIQANPTLSVVTGYWEEIILAAMVYAIPFYAAMIGGWRHRTDSNIRDGYILLLLLLVVPSLLPFLIDMATRFTLNPRHAIVCLIPLLGFVALGISTLRPTAGIALIVGIVAINGVALKNYYSDPIYAKEDARAASDFLNSLDDNELVILVVSYPAPIERYYIRDAPILGPSDIRFSDARTLEASLTEFSPGLHKLAYVDLRAWHTSDAPQIEEAVTALFSLEESRRFQGITVNVYQLRDGGRESPPSTG